MYYQIDSNNDHSRTYYTPSSKSYEHVKMTVKCTGISCEWLDAGRQEEGRKAGRKAGRQTFLFR